MTSGFVRNGMGGFVVGTWWINNQHLAVTIYGGDRFANDMRKRTAAAEVDLGDFSDRQT
jgi:hypothetical protein